VASAAPAHAPAHSTRRLADDAPHLLLVDDDRRIRDLLSRFLSGEGYRVTTAMSAKDARAKLLGLHFDLLILDVMMPGETGFDLARFIRTSSSVPIIMLTARHEAESRIEGLQIGADDYVAKPFEPRELVLRIRNILQRRPAAEADGADIRFGGFRFDLARSELWRGAEPVHLTAVEAGLLASLAGRAGEAVSREELAESTQFSGNTRTVDVQMTRLRRKIERDPRFPRYLQTVRGTGYALRPD
jgi:two-component system phosphate regulon response regulator OmpR